ETGPSAAAARPACSACSTEITRCVRFLEWGHYSMDAATAATDLPGRQARRYPGLPQHAIIRRTPLAGGAPPPGVRPPPDRRPLVGRQEGGFHWHAGLCDSASSLGSFSSPSSSAAPQAWWPATCAALPRSTRLSLTRS